MLPSIVVRSKAGRFVPVLLAALILAACSSQSPQTSSVNIQGPATGTSDYYLQQVQQSADNSKADWQLLAIRALLNEGKYPQANQQITQLPQQLSDKQRLELQLLNAQLRLGSQDMNGARRLLASLDTGALSADQKSRYYGLLIAANQGAPSLDLLRAYVAQEPLLSGADKQKNIDATWQALTGMTQDQVNRLVINADENTLQGWIDLLSVWRANSGDAEMLKSAVADWQTRYPQHPATKMLPTSLSQIQNYQHASASHIALMLPLNGQAKVFANAIQQGFNDAKNGTLAQPAPSAAPVASAPANGEAAATTETAAPAEAISPAAIDGQAENGTQPQAAAAPASTAEVKVYDTSAQPLAQLMTQAQQDGATLIVGPLLKNEVETLANSPSPLNILALNEPSQIQNHPNLCYFALSPEDEARDAAHHMWDQGKRSPLLLLPRSNLGDRVSKAFAQEWQKLGGATVLQQQFGSKGELKQGINSGAGISLTGTPISAPQPEQPQGISIAGLNIPAPQSETPAAASGGGSVDAVYIVATQDELQLIKPMIAMRLSSRNNIALYASSRSFQAGTGPDSRLEMEGLQFSDIPLLAGRNPALMQQAARTFNNDYSLVRLYAMGIDAWALANHFNEMRQTPGFQLEGKTGTLSASPDCVINRKLAWSQYRQGQIVPVQ
ncbi:penicillin-binding protein activator [Duffyella gerundensis]|uniref:penicillin-binding protein activator n=1 Tax=Duffyella gerundensis TaxID=1619313 RepID=UPI0021F71044|nr:penicillin-binding protein activator [Duffyella gerundensis]